MYPDETTSTQELDGDTVKAMINATFLAEFTTIISKNPSAFQTNEFIKEKLSFLPQKQHWVVLTTVSLYIPRKM